MSINMCAPPNFSLDFGSLSPHPWKGQLCRPPQLPEPEEDLGEPYLGVLWSQSRVMETEG